MNSNQGSSLVRIRQPQSPAVAPFGGIRTGSFPVHISPQKPPEGISLYPLEPDHAHNYFIHQTVEQGFLGALSSLGIFAAVFLAGAYQLLKSHRKMSSLHKLIQITLVSVLAGRDLEMMVGVARVSDLMIFWVLMGMFTALPMAIQNPAPTHRPISTSTGAQRPHLARSATGPRAGAGDERWLWKFAMVTSLIGVILVLTWMQGINYPWAAVKIGHAMEYSRQGDLPSTLGAIDRAIGLAPDVPVYYNWRASVFRAYRRDFDGPRDRRCDIQKTVSYQVCLAALTHESNLAAAKQRPFYFRSQIAAADSAFNLRLDDEATRRYRESLNLVPRSWTLNNKLASVLIQQGKPDRALDPLQKSLEITSGTGLSADALLLRATAYVALGRHREAIDDLEQVIDNNAQAHAIRALAYANLGQDSQAREDAGRAGAPGADHAALDKAIREIKLRRQ